MLKASASLEDEAEGIEEERTAYLGNGRSDARWQRRDNLDPLRAFQSRLQRRLLALDEAEAVEEAVRAALGNDRLPFTLRLALAERARDLPGDVRRKAIGQALRSREPARLAVALRAIITLEHPPTDLLRGVRKLIDHRSVVLRELAAQALSALAQPEGVEPLIRRIASEEGRTRQRFADALQILTGQPLGNHPAAWSKWWDDHGAEVLSGELPLGNGVVEASSQDTDRYHGIPVDGARILFVLDRSESMRTEMGARFEPGAARNAPRTPSRSRDDDSEEQRIDRAKAELVHALGSLSAEKAFNIVVFAAGSESFAQEMVEATPRNVKKAQQWVRDLRLELATALYDGMDLGFVLGGRPVRDELYDADFDTMFVLTDGLPTLPGKGGGGRGGGGGGGRRGGGGGGGSGGGRGARMGMDSTDTILRATRRWNVLDRVVIHTIGLGDGFAESFLAALAEQNGGRFVSER